MTLMMATLIIVTLWLAAFVFYLLVSQQNSELEVEVRALEQLLDEDA